MSSPMMTRMFGLCGCCCADAGAGATSANASDASRASRMFQLLEPQRLADGQQVPVVDVARAQPAERAAEPEIRLFPLAHPRLERIALEVYHAGYELGLDSRDDEARRGFGRDREIRLPILVAHRRRVLAGIVEEGIARRLLRTSREVLGLVDAIERRLHDAGILAGLDPLLQFVSLGAARDVDKRGQPVERREDVVLDGAGSDDARPANDRRSAHAAFPGRHL